MLAALALAAAIALKPGSIVEWDETKNGPKTTYVGGGLTLEVSARSQGEDRIAALRLSGQGVGPTELKGEPGLSRAYLRFGVGKVDPASAVSGVLFMDFSGGAHCCTHVILLDHVQGAWRRIDLDTWDGEALNDFPKDEDGDGRPDLLFFDNAFLYAFASYAESWAPRLVKNVVGGKVADVSSSGRYRALYQAQLKEMRPECAKHNNGACAAFVAVAARLGRVDEAWGFMLNNYDRRSEWELPAACRRPTGGGQCPKGAEVKFSSYPEALRWFLGENGYMPPLRRPPPH
jgi:hypothetical protein